MKENRWSFSPSEVSSRYLEWPKVIELCESPPFNGPIERRGNSLVVFPDQRAHLEVLENYLNKDVPDEQIASSTPEWMTSSGEFNAVKVRLKLKGDDKITFQPDKITVYPFKAFDIRIAYLDAQIAPLFSRPAPQLLNQRFPGNSFFITRDTADKEPEGPPFFAFADYLRL